MSLLLTILLQACSFLFVSLIPCVFLLEVCQYEFHSSVVGVCLCAYMVSVYFYGLCMLCVHVRAACMCSVGVYLYAARVSVNLYVSWLLSISNFCFSAQMLMHVLNSLTALHSLSLLVHKKH